MHPRTYHLLACVGFDPSDPLPLALKIMRAGGGAVLLFLLLFVGAHALITCCELSGFFTPVALAHDRHPVSSA